MFYRRKVLAKEAECKPGRGNASACHFRPQVTVDATAASTRHGEERGELRFKCLAGGGEGGLEAVAELILRVNDILSLHQNAHHALASHARTLRERQQVTGYIALK